MPFELVIFDCDGVLIDSEALACRVVAETLSELGQAYGAAEIAARFAGFTDRDLATVIERERGVTLPSDFPEQVAARAVQLFETELQAIAGAEEVLEALPQPKCVASNSLPDRLARSLEIAGLRHFFGRDALFSAALVAQPKPAPDLHIYAAGVMGAAPARSVVIEDSPTGIAAARAAGMCAIGFTGASHVREGHAEKLKEAGAHEVAACFQDLPGLLTTP